MKGALVLLVALVSCSCVAEATFLWPKWGEWKGLWGYNVTARNYQPDRQPCPAPSCSCPKTPGAALEGEEAKPYVELTVSNPDDEAASCCAECKATKYCRYWQVKREHNRATSDCISSKCYLFKNCGSDHGYGKNYCYVLANYMWLDNDAATYFSGALCETEVKHDPHFLGAHGVNYDFNGVPGKVFALVTDERLAVNMLLHGYVDTHFLKKATLTADGKGAIRTWIRELGVVWKSDDGAKHTLRIVARSGVEAGLKRGPGFMELMEIDGVPVTAVAKPGDEFISNAGIKVAMQPHETQGPVKGVYYDLDNYDFTIEGLMTFQVSFRAAEPEMMMKDEAGNVVDSEVHISFTIHDLKHTPSIHGVLGETYREDHAERAKIFRAKVKQLKERIQADGETGKGFLDGEMLDYQVDSLFSTAWKFSAFKEESAIAGTVEGESA